MGAGNKEGDAPVDGHSSSGERGASVIEYALLVALIALVCISAVFMLGNSNSGSLGNSASTVSSAVD